MKKVFIAVISMMAVAVLLPAACTKTEEAPEPNFPEARTLWIDLDEGNTVTLSLNPNQAWTVSIPASSSDYWAIQNGAQRTLSIGGAAGNVAVQIVCLASEQDLEDHSVEVSMKMNGESRVIATITLAAGEPVFNVRPAEIMPADVDGYETFVTAEAGSGFNYEYSEPLEGDSPVKMLWNRQRNGYVAYIQVESNFSWSPENLGGLSLTELDNTNRDPRFRELEIFCKELNYPSDAARIYTLSLTSGVESFSSISIPVSVPVFTPVLKVRKAVTDETGRNFEIPEGTDSPYSWLFDETDLAQTSGTVDLIWRPEASTTEVDSYILVRSNFSFTIEGEDWLTVDEPTVVEEMSNDYETESVYHLSVDSEGLETLDPDGDNGEFTIVSGPYSSGKFSLSTPDVTGVFYVENAPLFEFDGAGKYTPSTTGGTTTSTKATVDITSYGMPVLMEFVLGENGKYTADQNAGGWIESSIEQKVGSAGVLLQYTVTVNVQPQPEDGQYRQGALMVFPESVYKSLPSSDPASVLFDENGNVRAEYSSYLAANIKQEEYRVDTGIISPVDEDYWLYENAKFEVLSEDPTGNGIGNCYKITYASPVEDGTILNSGGSLQIDVAARISEIRAVNAAGEPVTLDSSYWLQIHEVEMVYGDEIGTHYITMAPYGVEDPELYLIFVDNNGNNISVIQCVYDSSAQISGISLSLAQAYDGITLAGLPVGSPDIPDGMGAGSYWLMEYDGVSESVSVNISGIPMDVTSITVNPWGISWLKASLNTGGRCTFNIDMSAYSDGQATESYVLFYDSDNMIPVCIICRIPSDSAGNGE